MLGATNTSAISQSPPYSNLPGLIPAGAAGLLTNTSSASGFSGNIGVSAAQNPTDHHIVP